MSHEGPGEVHALDPSGSIDRVIERARVAGEALRRASDDRIVRAISGAAARLGDPQSAVGREAREVLPARSGLSPENVERTLASTLSSLGEESLRTALAELARAHAGRVMVPARIAGMVLAGNVFTAALRPLAWCVLARVPAIVKPSSSDEGLAELFAVALAESDPELGEAIALLRFARRDAAMLSAMASRCDVLHAWGSDRSIAEIRAAVPATTSFVAHGHGLGAAFVPADALARSGDRLEAIAEKMALDVALYDQRGCLSPHFVMVERGPVSALDVARAISEHGLLRMAREIPRGSLPLSVATTQLQWRGAGVARGELFEGDGWAVTYEEHAPLRLSPGHRNVGVYEVESRAELGARLAPFGVHLKALGVAGDASLRREIARALPPPLAPRVSAIGAMQTPELLAASDGEAPWAGLVRWMDVDP